VDPSLRWDDTEYEAHLVRSRHYRPVSPHSQPRIARFRGTPQW
jgi:hypothetical protein